MTFAAPLFLLAALAGIIPVVLHMINRQKIKDLPFPTLIFLRISVEKTRQRRRIQDLLLMLIRLAVLLLLAFGLARPALTNLASLFAGGATSAVAIVLDNSASMGMVDQDVLRFDTALRASQQILDELKDGDLIGLFIPCGIPFPEQDKLERTKEQATQMLSQVKVTYEKANLSSKLLEARKLLAKSTAPNKQIYIISDMQTMGFEALKNEGADTTPQTPPDPAADKEEGRDIPIIIVDVNRTPRPNAAVQGVLLETTVPVAGVPVKARVEVANTSAVALPRVVELFINGTKEAVSPVLELPPLGRAVHEFSFSFDRGGLHKGEVRLAGDDGSKFDDRRYFTMEVDQGIPVAIVKARRHEISYLEDAFYLEQALSPGREGGWALRVVPLVTSDLAGEPLENYRVIYLVNVPALGADEAQRLARFVENGGSVVWICGENVDADAYNQMNAGAEGKILPGSLLGSRQPDPGDGRDSWRITYLEKEHPALRQLVEPASLYESVLVYRHMRIDAAGDDAPMVLARLDDGEPLLVQRSVGRGKVLMLGTGVHVNWTNLPLRNLFLPLFARLTFNLSGAEQVRHEALAGMPITLQLEKETMPLDVEILPPTGETIRLKTQPGASGGQEFRYADTHAVGIYQLRVLAGQQPTQLAYSVNVDPAEADPQKVDREELQRRLAPTPLVFADNPDDLTSTFKWLREGKSLWGTALVCVLIALVFETFVSNAMTPKQDDEQIQKQLPSYMRRKKKKATVAVGA
jgi:hypothetical protein